MVSFPDAVVTPQVQGPALQGSVFGGHAPITGSHIYLLQPGTSGIGSPATSILGNNGATSANGYALTANTAGNSDPNIPLTAKYVTSDSSGGFSLSGAYSCAVGQPVYIYAYGGNVGVTTPTTVAANVTTILVARTAGTTGSAGTATYTVTVSSAVSLTAGENVTVSGLSGRFGILNTTQTILPAGLTTTTFEFLATSYYNGASNIQSNTYTQTTTPNFGTLGTVTAAYSTIVQLATLGNCPSSGNFSTAGNGAISYVFMNEVSTVAAAYTFQPFTSSSNNSAWDIGSSGTTQGLVGIENAANTAGQLYSIQGNGQTSTASNEGEGHLANTQTQLNGVPNQGNGVVPQTTIDTLANIVAACLDSAPATGGGPSGTCNTLFSNATDNGLTTGTYPTDTATAAINIARYPAGNNSSTTGMNANFVSNLFLLSTGAVPYVPNLAAAPNDFTLGISYTGGGISATCGLSPHSIAVDGPGNIYTANCAGNSLSVFSPMGVPASSTGYGTALVAPGSIAIDSTSSHVWLGNQNGTVSTFTTAGTGEAEFTVGNAGSRARDAIDGLGNIWVTTGNPMQLVKLNSSGTVLTTTPTGTTQPYCLAIEPTTTGNIWVADRAANQATLYSNAGVQSTTGISQVPVGAAIDASGNVWFGSSTGSVTALVSTTGAAVTGSPFSTGNANNSDGIAIDGLGNVWVTNSVGATVYELNNAGANVSPSTGYGYTSTSTAQPDGIAIDGSGNVWYTSASAAVLYELVGAGAPVVTPLSYAVQNSTLGTHP